MRVEKSPQNKVFSVSIQDCVVETFKAGGAGGQNQNKRNSGVRVRHLPSGAIAESREGRNQLINKRKAFERMARSKEFQLWAKLKALKTKSVNEIVDEQMRPRNLEIEYF